MPILAVVVGCAPLAATPQSASRGPDATAGATPPAPSPPVVSPPPTAASTAPDSPSTPALLAPTPRPDAEPVHVVVPALSIDLPVIRPPGGETFPLCDVAEFLPAYGLPGLPGVTYLYAHARRGMFLALLDASRVGDGASLIGRRVDLDTDDAVRRTYRIEEVHRGVRSLDVVNDLEGTALILQTSETSHSSGPKLVVIARPVGGPVRLPNDWTPPVAHPRACA